MGSRQTRAQRPASQPAMVVGAGMYKDALMAMVKSRRPNLAATHVDFPRRELLDEAKKRGIGNPADIVHRFKGRGDLPKELVEHGFLGVEAVDKDTLRLVRYSPNVAIPEPLSDPRFVRNLVPDSVTEAGFPRDEQALMAITRYSRLVAFLLGLQDCNHVVTHWKTRLKDGTGVEVDDFYLGSESVQGSQVAVPVEAKLRAAQLQRGQIVNGARLAAERYPDAVVMPVAFAYVGPGRDSIIGLHFNAAQHAEALRVEGHAVYRFIAAPQPELAPGTPEGEDAEQED